jgi:hypothetical protein
MQQESTNRVEGFSSSFEVTKFLTLSPSFDWTFKKELGKKKSEV